MKLKPKEKPKEVTGHPTQPHWHDMNRKQRRETIRKFQSEDLGLEIVHPDAGGIDIGNESHYVAVPPTRDSQPVRRFGCTTAELKAMAEWLKQCSIRTVAMQSTGVYWIAVYDILEQAGLEVYLVNARETKNLPGRKSDVQESQWLMKLHTFGLLRNSFRPSQEIRRLRTYWRQRNDLVRSAGRHIQRMQKTLTQMNIQLANVLSDVSGMTGQAIIKAILAGERDAHKLAVFRDPRVKASEEQIALSLEGNWEEDLLFVLKQEQDGYEFCQKQMAECDRRLEQYLQQREDRSQGACLPEEKRKDRLKKKKGNTPQFGLRADLFRMTGTDLSQIDGIDVMTATTILSEAGWDMGKWKTEDHFVSWLRLCPDNRISGDKIIGKGRLSTNNRISIALKMAASTLRLSNTYLGAQFRRLRTKLGAPVAIKAMAAKLARLVNSSAAASGIAPTLGEEKRRWIGMKLTQISAESGSWPTYSACAAHASQQAFLEAHEWAFTYFGGFAFGLFFGEYLAGCVCFGSTAGTKVRSSVCGSAVDLDPVPTKFAAASAS